MSRLPKDQTAIDSIERLHRYARPLKPSDRDRLPTLAEGQVRLLELLRRARTPAPEADGYPANLGGDGRGGAELTPTEAAAEARIGIFLRDDDTFVYREPDRDVVADLAENAWGYLEQAVQSIGAFFSVLDRADRLASTLPRAEKGGAGTCLACGGDVSGAANDRLRRGLGPCCYWKWRDAGFPELTEFKRMLREAS